MINLIKVSSCFLKHFMAIVFEYLSKGEKKRLVFCCKLKNKLVFLSLHRLTFACIVFIYDWGAWIWVARHFLRSEKCCIFPCIKFSLQHPPSLWNIFQNTIFLKFSFMYNLNFNASLKRANRILEWSDFYLSHNE